MESAPIDPNELLRHTKSLRRLALALVRDPDRADDLVQTTLLKGLERAPAGLEEPLAWLKRVLRSVAVDEHRRARTRADVQDQLARELRSDLDHQPGLAAAEHLFAALRELEAGSRQVIDLRFFQGASVRETAERLGVPVNTVRSRQARALAQLRERLRRDQGADTWHAALLPLLAPGKAGISSASILTGVLTMKKLAVCIGVIAVLCLGWFLGTEADEPDFAGASPAEPVSSAARSGELGRGTDRSIPAGGASGPERANLELADGNGASARAPQTQPAGFGGAPEREVLAVDERGNPVSAQLYRIANPEEWDPILICLESRSQASGDRLETLLASTGVQLGSTPLRLRASGARELLVARTRFGSRTGALRVDPDGEEQVEVSVHPAAFLDVHVASESGRDAVGYELDLAARGPGEDRLRPVPIDRAEDRTEQDGRVRLVSRSSVEELFAGNTEILLKGALLGGARPLPSVGPADFNRSEAFELVIPEWGALELGLVWDEPGFASEVSAWALPVEVVDPDGDQDELWDAAPRASADPETGRLRIDFLALGRNWNIWVEQGRFSDLVGPFTVRGPAEAGEVAHAELRLPAPGLVVTAVLQDPGGAPLCEAKVSGSFELVDAEGDRSTATSEFHTDAEGGVSLVLDSVDGEPPVLASWELLDFAHRLRWTREFDPPLASEQRALGAWRAEPMAVAASGVVETDLASGVRGYVQLFRATGDPGQPFEPTYCDATFDRSGAFEIVDTYGELDPRDSYFLQGRVGAKLTTRESIGFGATGVTLRTVPCGFVEGEVQFVDREGWNNARYYFVPSGSDLSEAVTDADGRSVAREFVQLLPVGVYDLFLFELRGEQPLGIVRGVAVESGETTRDPRLLPYRVHGTAPGGG